MSTHPSSTYQFTSPYPQPQFDYPTSHSRTSTTLSNDKGVRSPSPTPSEAEEVNRPFISREYLTLAFYKRPKSLLWVSVFLFFGTLTILFTVYHKQIENWLRPAANWMQHLRFGWLIPIAILFVLSFPPLFGHEVVAVLCGDVYGLWPGFAIVAAGTLLGEIGNFYAFRYLCQARGDKIERESWFYACLARTVRQGGFLVAVMARLSVIPGHFTTAIFATIGMNIFVFILAAILSLPKQFTVVYLGVLLDESDGTTQSTKSRIISDAVVVISIAVTSFAMWFILHKMRSHRLEVVRERRARLKGSMGMRYGGDVDESGRVPLTHGANDSATSLVSNDVFNPNPSEVEVGSGFGPVAPVPQRWDTSGRAIPDSPGYGGPYGRDAVSNAGHGGYTDPYAYNSYPPPPSQSVSPTPPTSYAPPAGPPPRKLERLESPPPIAIPPPPPPTSQTQIPTSRSAATAQQHPPSQPQNYAPPASPPPQYATTRPPPAQPAPPQSPFDDSHAIRIPKHIPRYQLSDSGGM